ncbi:F-box/LRR-repeat protein [Striga hermonthica]|uniref:F-box/LRR-repeat protein n=1 Tax=Striga hermonthica TaxID=68872 RepID=A0A9N7NRH2_STRHE|nr:F-box/LRR-repeat protein [Striga hermonthica]
MEDRISKLPVPILHRILCFLSQKEAVRTCVLSKQWRHIGSTRPNLEFSEDWFHNTQQNFVPVLDRTLQGYRDRNLSIHKLHLDSSRPVPVVSLFNKWIPILALNIKALKLNFFSNTPAYSDLPSAVFLAESLEELHLCQCKMSPVESVRFKRLHTLILQCVLINDGTLEKLMLGCPLLERMVIFNCQGLENVRLVSETAFRGLKHFVLDNVVRIGGRSIEIDVPNLETLSIKGPWIWSHCQSAFLFSRLSRLTRLCLGSVILSSESFDLLSFGCPTLESLTLINCSGFEEFHLASDSIKWLTICTDRIMLKGATICVPSILKFTFDTRIHQPLHTFSFTTTTSKYWSSRIYLSSYKDDPDFNVNSWFLEVRRVLKALSGSQISLFLGMGWGSQNVPCSAVLRDDPPIVVGELYVYDCKCPTEFTNALLRVCRPSLVWGGWVMSELVRSSYKLSEFQFNILLANEQVRTEPCFWQHDLEQVFVETLNGQQWQLMQWTNLGELRNRTQDRRIRLRLKWRCQNV